MACLILLFMEENTGKKLTCSFKSLKMPQKLLLVALLVYIISSCKQEKHCFTNPLDKTDFCLVSDIEKSALTFHFESYGGFMFSLDTLYFSEGRINQEIDFTDDVISEAEINNYKGAPIKELVFVGDTLIDDQLLESRYGIVKRQKRTKHNVEYAQLFSKKKNRIIGNFEYYPYRNRFIISITN
jgi:hypothetical protein